MRSCGVVKHLFSRALALAIGASETNASYDRYPRGPSSTKGRIKVDSRGPPLAQGVRGVARWSEEVASTACHETS